MSKSTVTGLGQIKRDLIQERKQKSDCNILYETDSEDDVIDDASDEDMDKEAHEPDNDIDLSILSITFDINMGPFVTTNNNCNSTKPKKSTKLSIDDIINNSWIYNL